MEHTTEACQSLQITISISEKINDSQIYLALLLFT